MTKIVAYVGHLPQPWQCFPNICEPIPIDGRVFAYDAGKLATNLTR
jgi:hypothetical protein